MTSSLCAGLGSLVQDRDGREFEVVVVDKVYPLSQAADAVAHMLGHHATGKVVIAV